MDSAQITENEKFLLAVIHEFVSVVNNCIAHQRGQQVSDSRYAVEKPVICGLLDKNKYEPSAGKLARWKSLGWIDADKAHDTKSIYIRESRASKRMVVVSIPAYKELAKYC